MVLNKRSGYKGKDNGSNKKDNASKNLSRYIIDNHIDINEICRETGLNYNNVNKSISENGKSFDVDEFLEICNYINQDPKKFK